MQTNLTTNGSEMRVIYSTTDKAYLLLSGQTITGKFPSREEAHIAQLEREAPYALVMAMAIAEVYPQLRSRVLRAVQLVTTDSILPAKIDGQYRALSQSGTGEFYVVRLNGSLSCTCFDHLHRAPIVKGIRLWKHIVAAGIYRRLNEQAT